ncbi:MAG: DUF1829 domain-containing protein [Paenibacillaceae bacterium]|nr:DUF1829 domain-containing protein [Paenibacillaceae bacterium]
MNIQSIFWEDVENFLIMNDIRYTDNVIFTGKSGFSQKFDFVIPKSKQMGERIIQTINNPSKSKAESVLFAWEDIKNTRKSDSSLYAIINDAEKTISSDIISAFKQYDVRTILWSGRRQYINELSA